MNLYEYVKSNPINSWDSFGTACTGGSCSVGSFRLYQPGEYVGGRGLWDIWLANSANKRALRTDAQINFWPDRRTRTCCDRISFVQTAKLFLGTSLITKEHDWELDGGVPYPLSTPWVKGCKLPFASMGDYPGYVGFLKLRYTVQDFETCAICFAGCEIGANYGCVNWFHSLERLKDKKKDKPYYFVTRSAFERVDSGVLGDNTVEIAIRQHPSNSPSGTYHSIVDSSLP